VTSSVQHPSEEQGSAADVLHPAPNPVRPVRQCRTALTLSRLLPPVPSVS
jgi:hypothetical protein